MKVRQKPTPSLTRMAHWSFIVLSICCQITFATRMVDSNSLIPCMDQSSFQAELFHVVFTPDNGTLMYNINGISSTTAAVLLDLHVIGYGYQIFRKVIDPCSASNTELKGVCPLPSTPIEIHGNTPVPKDVMKRIPNALYYIPDLDGKVQVWLNASDSGRPLACVEADLGNGKTVHQKAVEWSLALIIGLGLICSAITSGLGNSNTAAHLASDTLSLFGYFQAQAFVGMTAVTTPPIVRAWTQNFQWSMGLIRVHFLQRMATWYVRATGGKPSTYLARLATTSVKIQKRINGRSGASDSKVVVVKGIERVGFVAKIEISNIFFTGYTFFVIFVLLTALGVLVFKYTCDRLVKSRKMTPEKFGDLRRSWTVMLKGILFRIVLIGFPQIVTLGFWEITKRDSPGEVALAVSIILTATILLGWACIKVQKLARRSIRLHKNPAYILYSNIEYFNKWGFLYVPYQATMYYFPIPILLHLLAKALFVGLGQRHGTVQAITLFILDITLLIAISTQRPYMDKKTNAFNISITAVNSINALFLVFFTGVFGVPPLAIGILGVLFFLLNVIFAGTILIMIILALLQAVISKNPETLYPPSQDDRGSFIKSQNNLVSELDALGATARGEKSHGLAEKETDSSRTTQFSDSNGRSSDAELIHPQYHRNGRPLGSSIASRDLQKQRSFDSVRPMGTPAVLRGLREQRSFDSERPTGTPVVSRGLREQRSFDSERPIGSSTRSRGLREQPSFDFGLLGGMPIGSRGLGEEQSFDFGLTAGTPVASSSLRQQHTFDHGRPVGTPVLSRDLRGQQSFDEGQSVGTPTVSRGLRGQRSFDSTHPTGTPIVSRGLREQWSFDSLHSLEAPAVSRISREQPNLDRGRPMGTPVIPNLQEQRSIESRRPTGTPALPRGRREQRGFDSGQWKQRVGY